MIKIIRSKFELYEFAGNEEDTATLQYLFLYFPTVVDGRVIYSVSSGSTYTDLDTGDIYTFNAIENSWGKGSGAGGGGGDGCEGVLTKDITVTGTTVGNYTENTKLAKGSTMTTLFENMVTKEQPPSYTAPSINISCNISGLKEVGEIISPIITVSFSKNDAGPITKIELYKNNVLIDTVENPIATYQYSDSNITLTTATISYNAKMYYEEGPIKNTNLGNPYSPGHIVAGSKTSANTSTITPVYASYIGIISSDYVIGNLTKIIKNTKSYTYKYSMSNQRIVYLYPKSFGDLTTVKDENNFENLTSFTKSYITVDGVDYVEYKLTNTASNSNGTLKFN